MMNLFPSFRCPDENAGCPDAEINHGAILLKSASFTSNRVEYLAVGMNGVVVELNVYFCWSAEDAFIHSPDFIPSSRDPAQRVVHGDIKGLLPVTLHPHHVTRVECPVKLDKSCKLRGLVIYRFAARYWLLFQFVYMSPPMANAIESTASYIQASVGEVLSPTASPVLTVPAVSTSIARHSCLAEVLCAIPFGMTNISPLLTDTSPSLK
jgi:hypothetical protein